MVNLVVLLLVGLLEICSALKPTPTAVTYTKRSFVIYGKPTLILSGSVHYNRVPPSDWESIFQLAKELGLNCIQTVVIWSQHEPTRGTFSWEGYGDLNRFIELAVSTNYQRQLIGFLVSRIPIDSPSLLYYRLFGSRLLMTFSLLFASARTFVASITLAASLFGSGTLTE
jgi:hypothetical protein